MVLATLRYKASSQHANVENKYGFIIFDGKPIEFHNWKFKTKMKIDAVKSKARLTPRRSYRRYSHPKEVKDSASKS